MKISDIKVELIESMGTDLSCVNSARVSFSKTSDWEYIEIKQCECSAYSANECVCGSWDEEPIKILSDKDCKLINYLAKHGHFTPFTHCFASFRIKVPVFVARQLHKHQIGLSVNEESRRYVSDEPEFYIPDKWRSKPDGSVKQGSSDKEIVNLGYDMFSCPINPRRLLIDICEQSLSDYELMLSGNVCAEQARMILPLNTMTNFIWSGSLYAFSRVCNLRLDAHSQSETRDVAKLISVIMSDLFPVSWEALVKITNQK